MKRMKEKRVSISLPSLRIDSVLKESLEETQQVRKTSLTFAPEAGTQRMRDVINKGVTEEDLLGKVRDAFEGGWSSVKLYFMSGLPTETTEDLDGIADLARKVIAEYFNVPKTQRAKGLRVTVSVSVFVPKPFTPFQWAAQDTLDAIIAKQEHLRQVLNIKGVTFHWHEPYVSFLEACFARGDRRMGRVLRSAFEKGCILDGWNETFRYDLWMEAFRDCGQGLPEGMQRMRSAALEGSMFICECWQCLKKVKESGISDILIFSAAYSADSAGAACRLHIPTDSIPIS